MKQTSDIVYSTLSEHCRINLYLPDGIKRPPVYIHFHGGGLEGGDITPPQRFVEFLTDNGIAVASAGYRLYPDAKFPDYLIDCAHAIDFVLNCCGIPFGSVTVGGSSAGAYLSMMLYFDKRYLLNAGVDPGVIKGYIFSGGQPTAHFNYLRREKNIDERSTVIDEAAPIYYVREPYRNPEGEPWLLFICGENDMLNRVNQNRLLVTAMQAFGYPEERCVLKVYENESHTSYTESERFLQDALALIHRAIGRN